ncbi:hypothetical protein BDV12DRAFT_209421 [Aspergillus spectabilis]
MEDLSCPSPMQLALALAIVKTKPAGQDIKEYVLQIRKNIKPSSDAEISHSPDQFFDSVAFWKQAYEKSEAEQSKLLDRTYDLEQRNDALLAKLRSQGNTQGEVSVEELERKATSTQTARKRAKTQLSMSSSSATDLQALHGDGMDGIGECQYASQLLIIHTNVLFLPQATGPFMRQYYTLQKILQKRPVTTSIVQAAVTICKTTEAEIQAAVPQVITKSKSRKIPLTQPQISHLNQVLHGVEAAVALLFQALRKLAASSDSERETGLLTYHIIRLYEAIMNILTRYCTITSIYLSSRPDTKRCATKFKHTHPMPDSNSTSDPVATHLTSLLSQILTSLDLALPTHQNLLEAFLYILLTRAGRFLCLFSFQELQLRPDLRIDPSKLSLPAGLQDVHVDEKTLASAEVEARYLIPLLRSALAVFNSYNSSMDTGVATEEENSAKSRFLASVKERLQSTLVQAVWGADPEFGRTLQGPVSPEGADVEMLLDEQRNSELSVPDWYVRQVWELVGWDILMKGEGL